MRLKGYGYRFRWFLLLRIVLTVLLLLWFVTFIAIWLLSEQPGGPGAEVVAKAAWSATDKTLNMCTLNNNTRKAYHRARTKRCRRSIVQTFCGFGQPSAQAVRITASCPLYSNPSYVGCYADRVGRRLLKSHGSRFPETNSVDRCISACFTLGMALAGVEYRQECFCGKRTEALRTSEQLIPNKCQLYQCPGNGSQWCGGYNAVAVYKTGYREPPPAPVRQPMYGDRPARIAFLLQLNGRADRQVKRLLRMIYRPEHVYFVHVDQRQDYMYRQMLSVQSDVGWSNFHVASKRFATIWGSASLLEMVLQSMEELLSLADHWDYVVNLSESDLPLRPVEELAAFLGAHNGTNFLNYNTKNISQFIQYQGLNKLFVECDQRMWRLADRELPVGLSVHGGSDWFILHRTFVSFILEQSDTMVSALRDWFAYSLLPVESFFHMVLDNSVYCTSRYVSNLRFINWQRDRGCKCQYLAVVDWCGCSPMVLLSKDHQRLLTFSKPSRLKFFARKFDPIIDMDIVNAVEKMVLSPGSATSGTRYWQNQWHHEDRSPPTAELTAFLHYALSQVWQNGLPAVCKQPTVPCRPEAVLQLTLLRRRERPADDVDILALIRAVCFESSTYRLHLEGRFHRYHGAATNRSGVQFFADVGKKYDLKEQVFRDHIAVYGVNSKPTVRVSWTLKYNLSMADQILNVTWYQPSGEANERQSARIKLDSESVRHITKSHPTSQTGVWKVQVDVYDESLTLKFPVVDWWNGTAALNGFYELREMCLVEHPRWDDGYQTDPLARCALQLRRSLPACSLSQWSSLTQDDTSHLK